MNRLVNLVLGPEGEIREEAAARVVAELPRSELKRFLWALRRELRRRVVQVDLAGAAAKGLDRAVGRAFPGRVVRVGRQEALGAGLRVSAGDDILDASVYGYIRAMIEELGEP